MITSDAADHSNQREARNRLLRGGAFVPTRIGAETSFGDVVCVAPRATSRERAATVASARVVRMCYLDIVITS